MLANKKHSKNNRAEIFKLFTAFGTSQTLYEQSWSTNTDTDPIICQSNQNASPKAQESECYMETGLCRSGWAVTPRLRCSRNIQVGASQCDHKCSFRRKRHDGGAKTGVTGEVRTGSVLEPHQPGDRPVLHFSSPNYGNLWRLWRRSALFGR